jgi:colanic acid/amylovoran biosynthesis glycosyltransferase
VKVLVVVNQFPVLSETFILDHVVGLLRRGHDVTVLASAASGNHAGPSVRHADVDRYGLLDRLEIADTVPEGWTARAKSALWRGIRWGWRAPASVLDSVNVLRYGRRAFSLRLIHERFPDWPVKREYDVIHCHFGPNGERAVRFRAASALVGPIITSFHGYDVNTLPKVHGKAMYRSLFREGDLFTVGSEFMRRQLLFLGAPEGKIVKHPMGVNLSAFRFRDRTPRVDGSVRLLTVARLVEAKGIACALRAVALVRRSCPGLTYTIVGDGPLRGELEALADQLAITDAVTFAGALPREQVIEHYQMADLFVLPSVAAEAGDKEVQAVVLAEAQASGLPIVASRIGGIPDSVKDRASAILVPASDVDAMADAIATLAARPNDWARMGRVGREMVEERFDAEKLADQLEQTYLQVIDRYRSRVSVTHR